MLTNLIKINDTGIKRFLIIIVSLQLATLGVIGLEAVGLSLPFLRQATVFIYLSFVPGILILRVLKLHRLSTAETLGYAVGLSIASVMFIGLILNSLGPLLGIHEPLSIIPLLSALGVAVLILCLLSYIRDKDFCAPSFIATRDIFSPPVLFLLLLPLLSILGALVVNFYHTNTLLLLLMVLIALIPVFIIFGRFIPKGYYPLALFTISLAIIYHQGLIPLYLVGTDISWEYYFSKLVLLSSHWDPAIPNAYNACLSITIFPAVYSRLMNLDLVWMFKAIYPVILSIVPLVLYEAFRRQVGSRKAFLAAFLIVSFVGFSTIGVSRGREIVANLFLALLILLLVSRGMDAVKRAVLLIIFAAFIVVSHYSMSYVCLILLALSLPLTYKLYAMKMGKAGKILSVTFVMLLLVMSFSWYMYISGATAFNAAIGFGQHIYVNLGEFFNPLAREQQVLLTLGLAELPSWGHQVTRFLFYLVTLFIGIGAIHLFRAIFKGEKTRFKYEFISMTPIAILMLAAVMVVPLFSYLLGPTRFYHIALLILAPIGIVGGEACFNFVARLFKSPFRRGSLAPARLLVLLVLVPFFLYNTGFVYEVSGDVPSSIPLSMERIRNSDDPQVLRYFDSEYTFEQEVVSAGWLKQKRGENIAVWGDMETQYSSFSSYSMIFPVSRLTNPLQFGELSYIYLNHMNVANKVALIPFPKASFLPFSPRTGELYHLSELIPSLGSRIYTNGASEIYFRDTPLEGAPLTPLR